jgi:hypothetical protein
MFISAANPWRNMNNFFLVLKRRAMAGSSTASRTARTILFPAALAAEISLSIPEHVLTNRGFGWICNRQKLAHNSQDRAARAAEGLKLIGIG